MVRMGCPLDGVVSFHGLLQSSLQNILQVPDFDDKVGRQAGASQHSTARLGWYTCSHHVLNANDDDARVRTGEHRGLYRQPHQNLQGKLAVFTRPLSLARLRTPSMETLLLKPHVVGGALMCHGAPTPPHRS
jgi:hypothetical protein